METNKIAPLVFARGAIDVQSEKLPTRKGGERVISGVCRLRSNLNIGEAQNDNNLVAVGAFDCH